MEIYFSLIETLAYRHDLSSYRVPSIGYIQAMPIRGFLSGQAFEPEVVRQMSLALETICGEFGMNLTDEPATRVVALKIIELAQRGVQDAPALTEMTLTELKHCLPYAGASLESTSLNFVSSARPGAKPDP